MQNNLTDWQREMLQALLNGKQFEVRIAFDSPWCPVSKLHAVLAYIKYKNASLLRIKRETYRMYSQINLT